MIRMPGRALFIIADRCRCSMPVFASMPRLKSQDYRRQFMPAKIAKITNKQKAKFAEWVEKWIESGLSCEPADFDSAERAARESYKVAGLKQPKVVLRL